METIPHIPALRLGRPYESLDKFEIRDHRSGGIKAVVSAVNAGVIRRDIQGIAESRASLKKFTVRELIELCSRAGEAFRDDTLPLGDRGHTQSAQQYIETLSATGGMPQGMVRRNVQKIYHTLANTKIALNGLTRGPQQNPRWQRPDRKLAGVH